MIARQLTLISLIISINALSIGTVSEQNVTKREANLGDLYPDWVPFKNKHGEELGEFIQVNQRKPKKRLAPPVNFILRAVAEPEGDDYFEKGQGESDGDEYYEKKDWSDIYRAVQSQENNRPLNHTEISEIDGVVNIITNRPTNPVIEALRKAKLKHENLEDREKEEKQLPESRPTLMEEKKTVERKREKPGHKYEDDIDYEESVADRRKPEIIEEDQTDSETKKATILDSVDELKERHAKEQIELSEKAKEEEIYKEEHEREKIQAQLSLPETDKYDDRPKTKKKFPDYEEYEDKESSLDEKYRFNMSPERTRPTTTIPPKRTTKTNKLRKDKKVESGKLSVFKNPQLYIVYDDDSEETTTVKPKTKPRPKDSKSKPKRIDKFSAKYSSTSPSHIEGNERISLVPEDNEGKEGEPTLFFPKKRKNKKRKNSTTTAADSATATTAATKKPKQTKHRTTLADTTGYGITGIGTTGSDTTGSDTTIVDTTAVTRSTVSDMLPTNTNAVTDAVPASTQQHKEPHKTEPHKKDEDYHREKGGTREHHSEHDEDHSEEGKKAYEGVHKETKSAKGHHDKEDHLGKYDDHGGTHKHHEEESGHYGDHHHEEHGKKHAKYEESGKHSKGHSTKGSHDIHKKEEYEKKVEFFEEEGDSAEEEKHGGHNEEHSHAKGGQFKNGNYKAGHEEHAKGDSGHFAKGGHLHLSKGHKSAAGHEGHAKHGNGHIQKEGKESGKKWIYHHGYPPKTANLVLIDRRADQLYHGPQYFG